MLIPPSKSYVTVYKLCFNVTTTSLFSVIVVLGYVYEVLLVTTCSLPLTVIDSISYPVGILNTIATEFWSLTIDWLPLVIVAVAGTSLPSFITKLPLTEYLSLYLASSVILLEILVKSDVTFVSVPWIYHPKKLESLKYGVGNSFVKTLPPSSTVFTVFWTVGFAPSINVTFQFKLTLYIIPSTWYPSLHPLITYHLTLSASPNEIDKISAICLADGAVSIYCATLTPVVLSDPKYVFTSYVSNAPVELFNVPEPTE